VPVGKGAKLGREGVRGLERLLDHGGSWHGLRGQETDPGQRHVEGAQSPTPPTLDRLVRVREESASSWPVTRGQLGVHQSRQDARLVPEGSAPRAGEIERGLEGAGSGGHLASRERGGPEKRRGFDSSEGTAALVGQRDRPPPVSERAGDVAS